MAIHTQHTPGPWSLEGDSLWGPAGTKHDGVFGKVRNVSDADARLIAAAPDLLEALTLLLEANDGLRGESTWMDERLDKAAAAIAKAVTA